jgi:hypothetical protein
MKLHELTDLAHKVWGDRPGDETPFFADLERFAALVAAAEREVCAKLCDEVGERRLHLMHNHTSSECAAAIRARGQE